MNIYELNPLQLLKIVFGVVLILYLYLRYSEDSTDSIHYPNGQLKSYGSFVDGRAEGTWSWWFENGNKMSEGTFVDGNRNGEWITWFENGVMKSRGIYLNDKLNGAFVQWFDNGVIALESHYLQDKLEGSRRHYDAKGEVTVIEEFESGVRISISDLNH